MMSKPATVVSVGFLTPDQLKVLRAELRRSFPVEATAGFGELLVAVDKADEEHVRHARAALAVMG